ncbi:oxidoreductase activity protein [[Candida] boidinii]|nr:oxidoreductase activity protein [[Candida] boidinii]OWB75500.1 oxidoreductase activity protein [[Candida] boidinii]OWB78803.1 oxidoreductase activity protein [[Candida] boidinii]
MMKALVYGGPGEKSWKDVPKPKILKPTDAIVKTLATTICGSDLHILKGDVPETPIGTILGHESIGEVSEIGSDVKNFKIGQKVIVSCITSCGDCYYCKKDLQAHCLDGGWNLGHDIDGTQAEFVRIPHADYSLYDAPEGVPNGDLLMLSDILPTSNEVGVISASIEKGDIVAIVGAGPVGLSALLNAKVREPSQLIMIDLDETRLELAKKLGATTVINPSKDNVLENINSLTQDVTKKSGVDVAIECVGVPQTFQTCQDIIAPGGRIANVGVHGKKVDLQLQLLWIKNIRITTGLVSAYSTPALLKDITDGKLKPDVLVTHKFKLDQFEEAYEVFSNPAKTGAIKVLVESE